MNENWASIGAILGRYEKISEDTNSTKYTNVHTRRKEENQMEKTKRLATSEDYPIEIMKYPAKEKQD